MDYFSDRNGLRTPIKKTYIITPSRYKFLFKCCERYFNNIAWKYPEMCPDGGAYYGIDLRLLSEDLKYAIPDLYVNDKGIIDIPLPDYGVPEDDNVIPTGYNQYALLDFVEFMAENVSDISQGWYHKYFSHYHLVKLSSNEIRNDFIEEINACFSRLGLLYTLTANGHVERVVENGVVTVDTINTVLSINEKGTKDLLQEALDLYRSHNPNDLKNAVEKIWDAFERLKTYYTNLDKQQSSTKIINDMADQRQEYIDLFREEFLKLTYIGNSFRIRHHETDKYDIPDDRYYDYLFNRCLSIIALAVQYLK